MQTGYGVGASSTVPASHVDRSTIALVAATACLVWYSVVALVCLIGYSQLWRHYSTRNQDAALVSADLPHVTVIRPVKGLEPSLYACLASTFRQKYPHDKLHIRFCVPSRNDPSFPVLERLIVDFPRFDANILVEEEDAVLQHRAMGPNPKIRNMSRAYREAIGNLVWIIDCNVWIAKGVCGRLIALLEGVGSNRKYKFVHQLPLVVDTEGTTLAEETRGLLDDNASGNARIRTTSTDVQATTSLLSTERNIFQTGGGRLDELFLSSSHAKFYTAINTVLIAPCIVGKSTMFRRSHLNGLTDDQGIDFFSHNICEDHLIGDLLWKQQVPEEKAGEQWGKHAMCWGDMAIQPVAAMSVREYVERRLRWLRVRKFTVFVATMVEPGTESFLCSLYGAFAITTLPFFHTTLRLPQTWTIFVSFWLVSVSIWCLMDWTQYLLLQSAASIEVDDETPSFARPPKGGRRRPFLEWFLAWFAREALAFPIWFWAVLGGSKVEWRGKRFWVGLDMKVHEIVGGETPAAAHVSSANGSVNTNKSKSHRD